MLLPTARCSRWISYPRKTNATRLDQAKSRTLAGRPRFFQGGMWLLDFNGNGVRDRPSTDRLYWLEQTGDVTLTGWR